MRATITALCDGTAWDIWIPLKNCWRGRAVPSCPGLYRILLVEGNDQRMAYIGQSGNLKERLGALKHVYGDTPPLHTPHFACPALWQWQKARPAAHFLVSVAPFPTIPKPLRLGLECLAIALSQQESGASPLANFGRTRDEWYALWSSPPEHQAREMEPTGPLGGDPHAPIWCGLHWTPWIAHHEAHPPDGALGLYRLRVVGCDPLLYIGQGTIASRLKVHRGSMPLQCSWVIGTWSYHRRLELVSSAVGAHLLETATIPLQQFERYTTGPEDLSKVA